MARWIEWRGERWHLADLARAHRLAPGTLHGRLLRFGESATGVARALATGIQSRSEAGRRGKERSPWRHPNNHFS